MQKQFIKVACCADIYSFAFASNILTSPQTTIGRTSEHFSICSIVIYGRRQPRVRPLCLFYDNQRMTKYTLKYNFFILILRLTTILAFVWIVVLVIKGIMTHGFHFDQNLLGLVVYFSVPTFLMYRILRRLLTESNYISLDKHKIEIYNFIKFKRVVYRTTDCVFFHSSRRPFDTLILKLPTGKYINICSYDYFDFKRLDKLFEDNGISKQGFLFDPTA